MLQGPSSSPGHGETVRKPSSFAQKSVIGISAVSLLIAAEAFRRLSQPTRNVQTSIRRENDLPPMSAVEKHRIRTMEEYEGSAIGIGRPFLVMRQIDDAKEILEIALEGDGLNVRVGKRVFRLREITDKMFTHTVENIELLLGESFVTGVSIQNGLVLHAKIGDLRVLQNSFEHIVWALHGSERTRGPTTLHNISYELAIRDPIIQKLWTEPSMGMCTVRFDELPAAPDGGELARIDR